MTELAGEGCGDVPCATPVPGTVDALLVEVSDALAADLDTLATDDWTLPVVHGLTVQATIAHLAAVHDVALEAMHSPLGAAVHEVDLEVATDRRVDAVAHEAPTATRAAWHAAVHLLRRAGVHEERRICWLGRELSAQHVALDRAFETWVHANDIRRATNRSSLDPSGEHLKLLCEHAIDLLPQALQHAGQRHDATVTVQLAGPGGGTWTVSLGGGSSDGAEASLHASARELCLLVADRIDPLDFACTVRGDDAGVAAARALVTCAPTFARR
jgi:uncharacterized protein (TIGR03083 family)